MRRLRPLPLPRRLANRILQRIITNPDEKISSGFSFCDGGFPGKAREDARKMCPTGGCHRTACISPMLPLHGFLSSGGRCVPDKHHPARG